MRIALGLLVLPFTSLSKVHIYYFGSKTINN